MINTGKEFPDVTLQNPTLLSIIFGYFMSKYSKSVYRSMCSFV